MLPLLLSALAFAGYGDPVDGVPSPAERSVHVWTNAVRTAPAAFQAYYPCSYASFTSAEQTPQAPLLWNDNLGAASRFHSDDMATSGNFSHDSSDGTSFFSRISRYYSGYMVGENIAWGYGDPYGTVVGGWMCSSGHRSNIMGAGFDEIGAGVNGVYYTQNFGYGGVNRAAHPLVTGVHYPLQPGAQADFLLIVNDPGGAPSEVEVVVAGVAWPLESVWGTPARGTWGATVAVQGCSDYWFRATTADGAVHTFPATGSYGFGDCAYDDVEARWMAARQGDAPDPTGDDDETPWLPGSDNDDAGSDAPGTDGEPSRERSSGCDHRGAPVAWGALAGLLLVRRRRARAVR